MANKPTKSNAVTTTAGAVPPGRVLAGTSIKPLEVYHVREVHPGGDGPWASEPDKMSWIDPQTGLPCIMRRENSGVLAGYVGVGPEHPLFGVEAKALPHDPLIVAHGGISYAEACDERGTPSRSICHVPGGRFSATRSHAAAAAGSTIGTRAQARVSADLWWFGFSCDKSYDLEPAYRHASSPLSTENGRVYRDERYVVCEVTDLAAQLHAVAHGLPMPVPKNARPPVGLDNYDPRSVL